MYATEHRPEKHRSPPQPRTPPHARAWLHSSRSVRTWCPAANSPQAAQRAAAVSRATTPAVATSLVEHGIEQSTAESLANTILAAIEGAVMDVRGTALDDVEQHLTVLLDHHLTQADPRRQRA